MGDGRRPARSSAEGPRTVSDVAGEPVLFLRLDGTFYSYRPSALAAAESLEDATLSGSRARVPGLRQPLRRPARGAMPRRARRYLEPVPLLATDDGLVKVAVGSAVA